MAVVCLPHPDRPSQGGASALHIPVVGVYFNPSDAVFGAGHPQPL